MLTRTGPSRTRTRINITGIRILYLDGTLAKTVYSTYNNYYYLSIIIYYYNEAFLLQITVCLPRILAFS